MKAHLPPKFQPLTGLYEPSAIQQLPDGRFLVVEDEKERPFSLVTINADAVVNSTPLKPGFWQTFDAFWKLDDLEGLALDQSGHLYAIASHSRDSKGGQSKSRNKLVRFRIEDDRVVDSRLEADLNLALAAANPVLAAAAEVRDVKGGGGLNIEALEFSLDQQHLLIGLRGPLQGNQALIASIENPAAMFEAGESPRVSSTLIKLNLDGNGIRGMAFIPALNGYLVIAGPVSREQSQFQLWFWSGHPDESARRVSVSGLPGFEHAEGVSAAVIEGQPRIVLVSDDGNRKEGRCARFLLLAADQLQIAP